MLSIYAHLKNKESIWGNYLEVGYGSIKQGENSDWTKTDDKIDFTSKYGKKAFSNWYYAALLNFKTQMTAGYNYPDTEVKISDFLAPAYVLGAVGFDYKPKHATLTAFIAPFTSKTTIVNNQMLSESGAYGIKKGKNSLNEFGGYIRLFYKSELLTNIELQSKLDLFSNYVNKPQAIDVSWEVLITMKVNKYISATINTHLLYDDAFKNTIEFTNELKKYINSHNDTAVIEVFPSKYGVWEEFIHRGQWRIRILQ